MGFSTPPGHRNPTYDENTNGLVDQAEGVNVPDWEEDPNSPATGSNTGSVTVSLANSLVYARVIVKARYDSSGSFFNLNMRVNGDTGTNYDYEELGGSTTAGRDEWVLTQADDKTGTWAGSVDLNANSTGIACSGPFSKSARGSSGEILAGTNRSVSAPLNSVTAFDGGKDNYEEISMAVYGIEL